MKSTPTNRKVGPLPVACGALKIKLVRDFEFNLGERKFAKISRKINKELDSDQIEGGEFEFLGLEIRFERNKRFDFRSRILISDSRSVILISEPNFKIWQSPVLYFHNNFAPNSSKNKSYYTNFLSHLAVYPKIS